MPISPSIFSAGLNEIFSDIDIQDNGMEITMIPIEDIKANPYQPRKHFDEQKLIELSESITNFGILSPIHVKEADNGGYILIAGERRLRAAQMAGLTIVPTILVDYDEGEMREVALLENVQREDLNAIEEALGYHEIIEQLGYTQDQLAKKIGKSREHVTNMLRLLKLPESIQNYVVDGKLSMGHIRAIASIKDPQVMERIASKADTEKLSVRAVENIVKKLNQPTPQEGVENKTHAVTSIYPDFENEVKNLLHTKVSINKKQIQINYYDERDLERIMKLLRTIR